MSGSGLPVVKPQELIRTESGWASGLHGSRKGNHTAVCPPRRSGAPPFPCTRDGDIGPGLLRGSLETSSLTRTISRDLL